MPPATASTSTSQESASGGKEDLRGKDFAEQEAMLATEPPKAPNITFSYSEATLARMAAGDPIAAAVYEKYRQFQDSSTKDGVTLTPEQKLALAVQVMNEMGVSMHEQKIFVTKVFFGYAPRTTVGVDQVHAVVQSGAGVTIHFVGGRGALTPMTFGAPPVYAGKDDNLRGRRVEAAKHGFQDQATGQFMAPTADSIFVQEKEAIERSFLFSEAGKPFVDMTSDQLGQSPAYHKAYDSFRDHLQHTLIPSTVEQIWETFQVYASDPKYTAAEVVAEAIRRTLSMQQPDLFRNAHAEMRVDDEAVIELLLERANIEANVNSDDFRDMSKVVDKRGLKAPVAEKADATPRVDPTLASLATTNKLIEHLEACQAQTSDYHVGPESNFYRGLAPNDGQTLWNERTFGQSPCVNKNEQVPATHLRYFNPLIAAWCQWEKVKANKGDEALTKAAFDAAASAYMNAPKQTGGVTIGS